ncbi:Hpt domain-containing protein [Gilvimarinus sp. SDUM040013]|uniref:Hpt domain-containing protein n=1 Tax=Gilvimarinus gilvus TaxID=3058038 RepID=A0ABU4RU63_9GAMM|nr:Hpt domain-containing protein [Gilvimarinus sp. SDUM040013]MDO3385055.1 Hpt domain-containing protein [Gilvimarinus sp. SDUM040013]MDX6848430.1 Hpt domain-containing protein [Gilvimarinus sp. SDUM040013]
MSANNHIDHDTLATLQEVMEDDFQHLIETFISDSSQKMTDMQRALAAGLSDELRRAAHSFKGSSSNIGAGGLVALCKAIEDKAAVADLAGIEMQIVDLQQEFNLVKGQLDIYL